MTFCCFSVGDTLAAHIVEKMWKVYTEKDSERRAVLMQGLQGRKMNDLADAQKAQLELIV